MNIENTYEEVYQILSYMDKVTVMKIPIDIIENIKKKRNTNYKTRIDKNDLFNENNIDKTSMDMLCYFDYQYWMSDEKKKEIDKIIAEKRNKEELGKKEKYNVDDLFDKPKIVVSDNVTSGNELIEIKEKNVFLKIWDKIKNIFKIGGDNE